MTRTYTEAEVQARVDEAVAAALEEAAKIVAHYYGKGQVTKPDDIRAIRPDAPAILARIRAEEMREAAETRAHIDGIGMCKMPGKWRNAILARAAEIDPTE